MTTTLASESRQSARLKLPPMYTLVRVRPAGAERYCWTGYIYDISLTGMRFELDAAVEPGTKLEIRAMLPGPAHTAISASGRVIRIHDDDHMPGPVHMGLIFDAFEEGDQLKLRDYLAAATAPRMSRAA